MTLPLVVQCQGPGEPVFLLDSDNKFIARMDEGDITDAEAIALRVNAREELANALDELTAECISSGWASNHSDIIMGAHAALLECKRNGRA